MQSPEVTVYNLFMYDANVSVWERSVEARDRGELASSAAIVPGRKDKGEGVYRVPSSMYLPHAIALRASLAPGTLALDDCFTVCSNTFGHFALAQAREVQQKLRDELLTVETEKPMMDELNCSSVRTWTLSSARSSGCTRPCARPAEFL